MSETNVDYNFLGRSGLKVANIALGAVTFGRDTTFVVSPKFLNQLVIKYIVNIILYINLLPQFVILIYNYEITF